MKKKFKRFFISIFILIFSLAYFLSILPSFATEDFPTSVDLEERIFCYCSTSMEDLKKPSYDDYSSLCENLYRLIDSQEDYEKMYNILNNISFHLFGRYLSEDFQIEDYYYDEILNLYKNAIKQDISPDCFLCEKTDLDLFDVIFVYSYILHLDESNPVKKYSGFMEKILMKNGIDPLDFSLFYPLEDSYSDSDEELYPFEGSTYINYWGSFDRKALGKSEYVRKLKEKKQREFSQKVISQYARTEKNHSAGRVRYPGYTELHGRKKQ